MPIVVNRTGPLEMRQEPALTPQQREALWAQIVRNWTDQKQELFAELVEHGTHDRQPA